MGNYMPSSIYRSRENEDATGSESPHLCFQDFCEHFQDLLESAEHQTDAASKVVDSLNTGTKMLIKTHKAAGSNQIKGVDMGIFLNNKRTLKAQLQGIQKLHEAMTSLIQKAMNDDEPQEDGENKANNARDIRFYQRTVEDLKEEVLALQEENSTLKSENQSLKSQVLSGFSRGQSKETVSDDTNLEAMECQNSILDSVQVLPAKLQGKGIVNEFTSLLHTSCESSGYGLNIQKMEQTEDVRSDQPVLVLFMKATRLETDVLESLKGIKSLKYVGLVIVHTKEVHEPDIQPSEKLLASTFKKKGPRKIFDLAFVSTKGIYECKMNQTAVNDIISFMRSVNAEILSATN